MICKGLLILISYVVPPQYMCAAYACFTKLARSLCLDPAVSHNSVLSPYVAVDL